MSLNTALPVIMNPASEQLAAAAERLAEEAGGPRSIGSVKTLRISVTDHCNLRCLYCMPEEGLEWLPRDELLTYEEIADIARAALHHGIREFKITGGEPMVRKDLDRLIQMLRSLGGCGEISMTTNGVLLDRDAQKLRDAGLDRITVSMDTLDPARFRAITRTGDLARVWSGVRAAEESGFPPVKINVVVMREHNLDEVADFAELTRHSPRTIRFIEFMPLGRSRLLMQDEKFAAYPEIRARIEAVHGALEPAAEDAGSGPARVWRIPHAAGRIGFIHAISAPFCSTCNRLRLTCNGQLRSCLFDGGEIDVRAILRPSFDAVRLRQAFVDCVVLKPDQHQRYGTRQMSQIGG